MVIQFRFPDSSHPCQPWGLGGRWGVPDGALRPEKIYFSTEIPSDHFNYDTGVVENIAYMGDISIYHVRLPSGQKVIATLPNVDRFRKGQPTWDDEVILHWEPDSCVVLTI